MEFKEEVVAIFREVTDVSPLMRILIVLLLLAFAVTGFIRPQYWVPLFCLALAAVYTVKGIDQYLQQRAAEIEADRDRADLLDSNALLIGRLQSLSQEAAYLISQMVYGNIEFLPATMEPPVEGFREAFEDAIEDATCKHILDRRNDQGVEYYTIPAPCMRLLQEHKWMIPNFPQSTDPQFLHDLQRLLEAIEDAE